MKIRPSIFLITSFAIALIVLMIVYAKRPVRNNSDGQAGNLALSQSQTNADDTRDLSYTNTAQTPEANTIRQSTAKTTGEQMREGLAAFNDAPIVFYGRVQDQFGTPLNNVIIAFSVQVYNGHESGIKNGGVVTDANGFFTISGYNGERLSFTPKKSGYVLASQNCGGIYSTMYPEAQRVHPDPTNPAIIKMWKLQGAEPLVKVDKEYKISYRDKPIHFDLVSGEIVPNGGDLTITVNRPDGIISQQHPQNWSIDFEVVGGGFIETSGRESAITFIAPENGYQSSSTFGNNNGPDLVDKTFFIQSRNGQIYSKFRLLFGINNTPGGLMAVTFSGIANTNASRNWEATVPK